MKKDRFFSQISLQELREMIREELDRFFRKNKTISKSLELEEDVIYSDETTLEELDISVRLYSRLKSPNVKTLGDIKHLDKEEFLKIPGLGKSSWIEFTAILSKLSSK